MVDGGGTDRAVVTDADTDIAKVFATAWNSINNDQALAADFWPCCRVLVDAALLAAQETNLTALSIGPFRLAVSGDNRPVIDFVEVLFPSVIASTATGQAVPGAVSGVLTAACTTFVKLYRQGTVFGRSEIDRLRWDVLMAVRSDNAHAVQPSTEMVIAAFADRPETRRSSSAVHDAVNWLLGTTRTHRYGPREPLLVQLDNGGLLATV